MPFKDKEKRKQYHKEYSKNWFQKNKIRATMKNREYETSEKGRRMRKNQRLKELYNINIDDYENLIKLQDSKCAICKQTIEKLFVDHNHQTGEIRGLLCLQCNSGLGYFKDNIDYLQAAEEYLIKYSKKAIMSKN